MTDQNANTALKQYLITITSQTMELRERNPKWAVSITHKFITNVASYANLVVFISIVGGFGTSMR